MMANGDPHQPPSQQNPSNQPQSTAFLQHYFGALGHSAANPAYGTGTMGAGLAGGDQTTAPFLPLFPSSATNSSQFPDFSSAPSYYHPYTQQQPPQQQQSQQNANSTATNDRLSPVELKYGSCGANGSVELLLDSREGAASSTDGSSPFDANGSGGGVANVMGTANPFYNQFIQDNYLSAAMGVTGGTDGYPSTSFMGMNPYSHAAYYSSYPTPPSTHHQNSAALSSVAAMDHLMQSHQSSMFNQWKYGAGGMGAEKLANKSLSSGIKSSSTSSLSHRAPNPQHKVGPGTNNVRVRTLDKYRTVYTDRQRLELEKEFRSHQFVTSERKAVLAGELHLTERQVKIWFQNRRAKNRKQEPPHRSMRVAMTR